MKKILKKVAIAGISFLPLLSFAQIGQIEVGSPITTAGDFKRLLADVFNWVFGIVLFVSVVMLLVGGFQYVTSGGDDGKIKTAKKTLTYAIIGIAIAILSRAIVFVINSLIGGGRSIQ